MQKLTDRELRERIIGAVVLVIVAVLVVPIFLDGESDDKETISTSVILPGQNNEDRTQQTIVLNRDRSEPVPTTRLKAPVVKEPSTQPGVTRPKPVAVDQPARRKPRKEEPILAAQAEVVAASPATNSETGMWAVQLGSFSSQENAEKLAASLREQGYAAFLSQLQKGDAALHRVRIGPQKDRDSAVEVAARLSKGGHNGQVVPHP